MPVVAALPEHLAGQTVHRFDQHFADCLMIAAVDSDCLAGHFATGHFRRPVVDQNPHHFAADSRRPAHFDFVDHQTDSDCRPDFAGLANSGA